MWWLNPVISFAKRSWMSEGWIACVSGSGDRSSLLLLRTLPGWVITWGGRELHLGPQHIQQGLCRRRCVWPWCPSQLCALTHLSQFVPFTFKHLNFLSALTLCHLGFLVWVVKAAGLWVAALVLVLRGPGLAGLLSCRTSLHWIYRMSFRNTPAAALGFLAKQYSILECSREAKILLLPYSSSTWK